MDENTKNPLLATTLGCGTCLAVYRYNLLDERVSFFVGGSAITILGMTIYNYWKKT